MTMRSLNDLPTEVIQSIIFNIRRPLDHLAFSRSCPNVCRAYTSKICQALCVGYGFGRPNSWKEDGQSWIRVFFKVMAHAKDCSIPACSYYGVPPPTQCWRPSNRYGSHTDFPPLAKKRIIHLHLTRLGGVTIDRFIKGWTRSQGPPVVSYCWEDRPFCDYIPWPDHQEAANWAVEELPVNPNSVSHLSSHPVLSAAFCCQPPIHAITVYIDPSVEPSDYALQRRIANVDGITVKDVVDALSLWFDLPMSAEDKVTAHQQLVYEFDLLCECSLDDIEHGEVKCDCNDKTYGAFFHRCLEFVRVGRYDEALVGIWPDERGEEKAGLGLMFMVAKHDMSMSFADEELSELE